MTLIRLGSALAHKIPAGHTFQTYYGQHLKAFITNSPKFVMESTGPVNFRRAHPITSYYLEGGVGGFVGGPRAKLLSGG